MAEVKKNMFERGLETLSIPQKVLMKRTAKAINAEVPESADIDAASEAITEKISSKLGIEHPAAKAAIKTALDVGYDPLNVIGFSSIAKIAKAAKSSKAVQKIVQGFKAEPELEQIAKNYWKSQKMAAESLKQNLKLHSVITPLLQKYITVC